MRGDRFDVFSLFDHRQHSAILVERVQLFAHSILREAVVLGKNVIVRGPDDAGDWGILRQPLLLHETFERAVAPAAGGDFVFAGLFAVDAQQRPDIEALEERPPRYVLGELFDRAS